MLSDKSQRRIVDASLFKAVVDQFVERATHPVGDLTQFERLALGLMEIIDPATLAGIARPLCFHQETPPSIFARLLEKGGACAELALEFSPTLPQAQMLTVARQGEAVFARALAKRADLDRAAIDALVQRGEPEALRALAANGAARLDASARRALTQAARDDVTLARILLDRDDRAFEPEALFLAATRLERMGIILAACGRALADGQIEARRVEPALATLFERAAVSRDRDQMAALLAETLECRRERARAIVSDIHGEALALALTALGFAPEAAARVFLSADPAIAHDTDRVRALVALVRSTPPRAAQQVLDAIVGAAKADRDAPRRSGSVREELMAGPGWRRATPRVGAADPVRNIDRSA
jgi:uncharacterized protein (DUF2336 family)